MIWPVKANAARTERILEAGVQALDLAIALGVVGGGGDVLDADGLTQGVPLNCGPLYKVMAVGMPKRATQAVTRAPGAVVCGYRGQWHSFHPPGGISITVKRYL